MPHAFAAKKDGDLAQAALRYAKEGFAVLPVCPPDHAGISHGHRDHCRKPGKAPLVKWKQLQDVGVTPEAVRGWWRKWPTANIAVITGLASGVVVLDVDGDPGLDSLRPYEIPKTPRVRTGRGRHYYFRAPDAPLQTQQWPDLLGVELKADGAYVVAPPSRHVSGVIYTWEIPLDAGFAPCPDWLLERCQRRHDHPRTTATDYATILRGVPEGQRTTAATRLAGHFLAYGLPGDEVLEQMLCWNFRNQPPLPALEVMDIVRDIAAREARAGRRRDAALLGTPWVRDLQHSDVAIYEALRVVERRRGYSPGTRLFVSHREVGDISGYSLGAIGLALHRLADTRLIRYQPGVAGAMSKAASEVQRILPLPAPRAEGVSRLAARAMFHRLRSRKRAVL